MIKKLVIIGLGRIGRALSSVMPDDWILTLVDSDETRLSGLSDLKGDRPITKIIGDATSPITLEEAGLSKHTALVITTESDKKNIEIAKVARQRFDVGQLVCMLNEPADLSAYGIRDFEVLHRSPAVANLLFNRICALENRAVGLGLGQGEILETRILEGSAAAGTALKNLKPQRWLVAAVYRGAELIVPHGETVLQADDRVLLVGEPEVLRSVGQFLRGGEPVFPTQFGATIGYSGGKAAHDEAEWLDAATLAEKVVQVDRAMIDYDAKTTIDVSKELAKRDIGCLVLDPEPIPWAARVGLTVSTRKSTLLASQVPVLIARGSAPPYKRVLVAVSGLHQFKTIVHVAIDLARQCEGTLTVLTVLPPTLSQGEEQLAPLREIPARVASIARMFDVTAETRHDEGNPIDCIREQAKDFDLLVIGHSASRRNTIFTPDVSLFLLHDAPCSTLFVPYNPSVR